MTTRPSHRRQVAVALAIALGVVAAVPVVGAAALWTAWVVFDVPPFPAEYDPPDPYHDEDFTPDQATPSELDGLVPDAVLQRAHDALEQARSGRVLSHDGGDGLAEVLVDAAGDTERWSLLDSRHVRIRTVDGTTYVSGAYPLPDRLVPIPDDRWVVAAPGTAPVDELNRRTGAPPASTLAQIYDDALARSPGTATLSGPTQVLGVEARRYDVGEVVTVDVAAHGPALPLSVSGFDGASLLFERLGEDIDVTAPPADVLLPYEDLARR